MNGGEKKGEANCSAEVSNHHKSLESDLGKQAIQQRERVGYSNICWMNDFRASVRVKA